MGVSARRACRERIIREGSSAAFDRTDSVAHIAARIHRASSARIGIAPGSLILADNVVRDGAVLAEDPADAYGAGVRAFNAALAAHPRLDSIIVPIYRERLDGLSISIVRG